MDSYFATVEQQANPLLRGKPIVVSGKEGSRTVIVASSKEAKKFGVKAAMLHHEARKLCPHLEFVEPDGAKYEYLCRKFINIFKQYTEKVEIFSIDEAFLDMSGYVKNWDQAIEKASDIKDLLKQELGDWMSCSVGIANNKLLAKLASGMDKPDGLFLIHEKLKQSILENIELTAFCGIGRRIKKRLTGLEVNTVIDLQSYPLEKLIQEFGKFYGTKLHNMSYGVDSDPVIPDFQSAEIKSVGRTYTLPSNTFDKEEIFSVLMHLCEKVGRELRRKKLSGKTLVYFFRYHDFSHGGFRLTLPGYINDSVRLFDIALKRINDFVLSKSVRLVGVHVSNLIKDYGQLTFLDPDKKQIELLPALDKINDRYGELTVKPAYLLKLKRLRRKVGGFKLNN
ncbi:DNA polymerase IV [Candidatus Falkowbacteria bacterium]|nr:DNA polymerase IV [Candidatus Falkowbacteria bacterium]